MAKTLHAIGWLALIGVGFVALQIRGCDGIKINADVNINEPESDAPVPMATLKRPNLVVSDMDRSLVLYADLLGFVPKTVETSSADSFSYPVFNIPSEAKIRFVTMHDKQDKRAFALTEVTGIDLPTPPAVPYMSAQVIGVTDLPGKFETLESMGFKITPPKTVEGTEFTFIEQAFVDYDGHLIVLYEVLK